MPAMVTSSGARPWRPAGEPVALGPPNAYVMLVNGQAFCLCDEMGDISPDEPARGLFVGDRRVLSRLELFVDGEPVESLGVDRRDPTFATHVGRNRPRPGGCEPLLVLRRRELRLGLTERLEVRNLGTEDVHCRLSVAIEADYADLFAVKEGRVGLDGGQPSHADSGAHGAERRDDATLVLSWTLDDVRRETVVVAAPAPVISTKALVWNVSIAPGGHWEATIDVDVELCHATAPASTTGVTPAGTTHAMGLETAASGRRWRAGAPTLHSGLDELDLAIEQSLDDLQALRLVDLERATSTTAGDRQRDHERVVIAAGAPWFMALFGRDALLSAYMLLPVDPRLAVDVLDVLAEHQGRVVDTETEEQPGRILHELRFGTAASLSLGAGKAYFGSVDATPLFVLLAAEAARWGALRPEDLEWLMPAVDRAMAWMDEFGDPGGLGYLSYHCFSANGLANQGWKDSWDGIRAADGTVATSPLALCEVQGYVYAAYRGRADLAQHMGDEITSRRWQVRATQFAERFNRDFWLPAQRRYAMAIGPDGAPVDGDGSNIGHCLWTGVVDEHRAPLVAEALVSPPLFSGWGVRTLAADNGGYNPLSYHCGSVWPHDTALLAMGLRRYGFDAEATQLALGLIDAAAAHDGHLPELFAGLDRADVGVPVRYPTSCVPQAWAAASLLLVARTLLGLEPEDGGTTLAVRPTLPSTIDWIRWEGVHIGGRRVRVHATGRTGSIEPEKG